MGEPRDLRERLVALEEKQRHTEDELRKVNAKLATAEGRIAYYDRFALKWGGFLMGMTALGAVLASGVEKVKEKMLSWLSSLFF